MEPAKLCRLLELLRSVMFARHVSRHDVERVTGKLVWLSGLFASLRPALAPLYTLQHAPELVLAALTLDQWHAMRSSLNADLKVTSTFGHPSVPVGSVLVRLARLPVSSLSDFPAWLPESQRIWVQVSHHTSSCPVNDTVRGVLSVWQDVLHDVTCFQSVLLAPAFACEAYADASADEFSMGLGGYIKFTSGVKRFFQCTFRSRVLCLLFLVTQHESGLSYIASWE